eukprot:Transcript_25072.p1 GENE.Transcript_25072~~Transcript_25072.p1  ORF type:complete len:253 (-),score=15.87 Transcript_25072:43-723(-)
MPREVLKRALLDHLLHRCYVKLAPSRIAGVGVLAVREIPPDTDPFAPPNAHLLPPEPPCIAVCEEELTGHPTGVRSQLHSFFAALDDPRDPTGTTRLRHPMGGLVYGINATGLERLDASWFVNHGEEPNVRFCEASADGAFNRYITTRTVSAGGAASPAPRARQRDRFDGCTARARARRGAADRLPHRVLRAVRAHGELRAGRAAGGARRAAARRRGRGGAAEERT